MNLRATPLAGDQRDGGQDAAGAQRAAAHPAGQECRHRGAAAQGVDVRGLERDHGTTLGAGLCFALCKLGSTFKGLAFAPKASSCLVRCLSQLTFLVAADRNPRAFAPSHSSQLIETAQSPQLATDQSGRVYLYASARLEARLGATDSQVKLSDCLTSQQARAPWLAGQSRTDVVMAHGPPCPRKPIMGNNAYFPSPAPRS
eukprot:326567-Chlamydomonas_euryale.AAC.1